MSKPDELHQAALKAIEATNLCMKHMKYHGQKYEECTPQKRVMIEVQGGKYEPDELDEIFEQMLSGKHMTDESWKRVTKAKANIRSTLTKARIDEVEHIPGNFYQVFYDNENPFGKHVKPQDRIAELKAIQGKQDE